MVEHIQADEAPHVEYLRTALSELRARTLRSPDGKHQVPGATVIDAIFAAQLRGIASNRPAREREDVRGAIHRAIEDEARASALAQRFENLDSGWVFPKSDGEHLELLLA
jgi:hypothetical protein